MDKKKILIILLILISCTVCAQQAKKYRQLIEDQFVPKIVRANFKSQYPQSAIVIWYVSHITYWYENYAPGWYGEWYGPERTTVVYTFQNPSYFEVDFYRNKENSRAIYNRYGHWFETRTKVSTLPDTIGNVLRQSGYEEWTWSKHKERIEAPDMIGHVYRLQVTNGRDSRIIRINEDGEIVQVRYD